jgi:hypothetical protein
VVLRTRAGDPIKGIMIRATWSLWVGVGLVLGSCVRAQDARVWSFEQAIVQVLADSPDARMAELRIEAARAGMQQANAALWPQVHLESDYMRTECLLADAGF